MARPPRRPDRPAGHPAWPARVGATALLRVARAVQRAAEALAPAAPSAAAAPPPEPPPRLPGQPPEHWLALVREHAPELLIGRDQATAERPTLPGHADPLPVPPARATTGHPANPVAAAIVTGTDEAPIAAAIPTASSPNPASEFRALPSHVADADRAAARIRQRTTVDRVAPAKALARLGGGIWARLSGKARTDTPPVDERVHSGQTTSPTPPMQLTPPKTPDAFPAWSWIGPSGNDKTQPAYQSTAAEWPSLPAVTGSSDHRRVRPAVKQTVEQVALEDQEIPWPDLPDDTPLWTVPTTGYPAERLARLDREQAGG